MKHSFKLHEAQQKKKQEDENAIDTKPCVVCDKILHAPYGRFMVNDQEVWTCRKTHDESYKERRDGLQN